MFRSAIFPPQFRIEQSSAIEFAGAEDTLAFLADGTGNVRIVKGITKIATDNTRTFKLVATNKQTERRHARGLPRHAPPNKIRRAFRRARFDLPLPIFGGVFYERSTLNPLE